MPENKLTRFLQAVPNPHLDVVRDDLNRLKLLWVLSTTSPLLYLAVSRYIRLTFFGPPDDMGFVTMTAERFHWLVMAFAMISFGVQAVHLSVRQRFSAPLRSGSHVIELLRVYRNRTLSLMAASEVPALLGFILFLIQGHLWTVFLFGIVSLIYYAQSYPSERLLGTYAKQKAAA